MIVLIKPSFWVTVTEKSFAPNAPAGAAGRGRTMAPRGARLPRREFRRLPRAGYRRIFSSSSSSVWEVEITRELARY